jgi:hypothetical protein
MMNKKRLLSTFRGVDEKTERHDGCGMMNRVDDQARSGEEFIIHHSSFIIPQ